MDWSDTDTLTTSDEDPEYGGYVSFERLGHYDFPGVDLNDSLRSLVNGDRIIHRGKLPMMFVNGLGMTYSVTVYYDDEEPITMREFVGHVQESYHDFFSQEIIYWRRVAAGDIEDEDGFPMDDGPAFPVIDDMEGRFMLTGATYGSDGYWHVETARFHLEKM